MRVQAAPMVKGDPTIAALQRQRDRQLQGESAVTSPSSARDNAPAGMLAPAPQAPSPQRDDLVGEIMADYGVSGRTPPPAPSTPVPPKTATIGQLAAAMGIKMEDEGDAPARAVDDEEELMESNALDPRAFLKGHAPQRQLTSPGLAAAALIKRSAPK